MTERQSGKASLVGGVIGKSYEDILTSLVKESPKAQIVLAGVPTECILDTGAETSLISASFYRDHLEGKLRGVQPLGTYLRVFGAGNSEVPIEGYIHAPLVVHNQTIDAHFLVVKEFPKGEAGNHKHFPVLLGCNVLHKLKDVEVDLGRKDADAWMMAINWYRLTKNPVTEGSHGANKCVRDPLGARTGRNSIHLFPREVRSITCYVPAHPGGLDGQTVLESLSGYAVSGGHSPEQGQISNIDGNCRVYNSCTVVSGRSVNVLVANVGRQVLELSPHTKLALVTEVSPKSNVALETGVDCVHVSVNHCLTESREYLLNTDHSEAATGVESNESDIELGGTTESLVGELYVFGDGSEYRLPHGLSLDLCTDLCKEDQDKIVRLIQKHEQVFSKSSLDIGLCDKVPHKIETTDDRPVNQPYRRIPPQHFKEVRELLQKFLDQGIIQKSNSPYASPIVLVQKKDGSLRICVDYRRLNAKTVRDLFPLPRIEESLEALHAAKYFSALDLAHGYHQVVMDSESQSKTAFRVPFGLFEYTRMPFGLVNAPGTFQRVMEMCLGDLNLSELLIYLDDILVFSSTVEEHIDRLDIVFARLADFGLKIKGGKCKLFCRQVSYLGHIVGPEGVAVDNDNIKRIEDWPVPKTGAQLRSFLGLAGYYRRFVSGFSKIAAPLHALVPSLAKGNAKSKPAPFCWSSDAQVAFATLKQALTQAPVLAYPDFATPFVLEIEASLQGLGACLDQNDGEGKIHPVAFAGRGLRGAEARYPDFSSFKLELLSLKWAVVDKFRDYLLGVLL